MGDRANVYIHEGDEPGVYLYTHWTGTELPDTVRASLDSPRGRSRYNDAAYLARIIFEDMISDDLGSETGYGISPYPPDGDDRIVDINVGFSETKVTLVGYNEDDE
jgi:hypothetical protein